MLPSLTIRNFKILQNLVIPKLARFNLFVGMNHSGKSSLLEALFLYANRGSMDSLFQVIDHRGGLPATRFEPIHPLATFFTGQEMRQTPDSSIQIGSSEGEEDLLRLYFSLEGPHQQTFFGVEPTPNAPLCIDQKGETSLIRSNDIRTYYRQKRLRPYTSIQRGTPWLRVQWVPSGTHEFARYQDLWDAVILDPEKRERVFEALRFLEPNLQEVVVIKNTPIILFKHQKANAPLTTLGDGINHLFYMILALVNAADGLLLIDEFENGIHYSLQPQIWTRLMQLAQQWNIQVFATTHSWDCIEAFSSAARATNPENAMLFRLGESKRTSLSGSIVAEAFDIATIETASQLKMELR